MTDLCRWLGGVCLVFGTAGLFLNQHDYAQSGALLAIAWYIAGQVAAVIEHQKWQRDQQDRP